MREIKFRAWQENLCCFAYTDSPHNRLYFTGQWFTAIDRGMADVVEQENPNIEQYTGLKDKNGEEIYEGDVVRMARNKAWHPNYKTPVYEVCHGAYDNGESYEDAEAGYGWHLRGKRVYGIWDGDLSGHEVIGNIHENPDLLSSEK